jgi:hypothetical protein
MFINRDWARTEEDDFKLNVLTRIGIVSGIVSGLEAVPVTGGKSNSEVEHFEGIIGWMIQPIRE